MKKIIIFCIILYQFIFSDLLKHILGVSKMCRYDPSCSEYSKRVIQKHGVVKGAWYSLLRIFSCQPFSRPGLA